MCDTLCALGAGRTLFAKNSDRPRDEVQVVERHDPRPPGGTVRTTHLELDDAGAVALVGSRPAWMWGFEHGINEHRVAIGNERIFTTDDPATVAPALTGMDLVRLALERAASAEHALHVITDLIARHGQGGRCAADKDDPYWSSFLIADPTSAWVLETSGRTWVARPVDDGAAISNRVTLHTDWTLASDDVAPGTDFDTWRDGSVPTVPSDDRLDATRACLATGAAALTPRDLAATLRHHGDRAWGAPGSDPAECSPPPAGVDADLHGFTVCFHVDVPGLIVETTTSSMIAELPADPDTPARAWVALGTPCASVYVPVFPPAAIPAELGDPDTWRRFAALRDRVERDPDALGEVRAVLGPIEADLWARADAAAIAADPAERLAVVGESWRAVDAALVRLGV
jgi:dipeptidase